MDSANPDGANGGTQGPAERLLHLGRNLLSLLVEAGRTRLELLAVEVAAERERLIEMLALGLAFGVAVLLGLAFASFLIIACFWDTHRLAAIAAVSLVYGLIAVAAALRLRRLLRRTTTPFANTRDTLERDIAALRSRLHPSHTEAGSAVEPSSGDVE
jgi:uncharacterized membrane protein YqjE